MNVGRLIILLFGILWNAHAIAHSTNLNSYMKEDPIFMVNCTKPNVSFQNNSMVLNSKNKQRIFIFQNLTDTAVWLDHPVKSQGVSAGWSSQLDAKHWTAFALNQPNFVMTCASNTSNGMQFYSCKDVLRVCELKNFTMLKTQRGSYWFVENQPHYQLLDKVAERLLGQATG